VGKCACDPTDFVAEETQAQMWHSHGQSWAMDLSVNSSHITI
jgi:hypothetical protein